jgi:hypothetical protein
VQVDFNAKPEMATLRQSNFVVFDVLIVALPSKHAPRSAGSFHPLDWVSSCTAPSELKTTALAVPVMNNGIARAHMAIHTMKFLFTYMLPLLLRVILEFLLRIRPYRIDTRYYESLHLRHILCPSTSF